MLTINSSFPLPLQARDGRQDPRPAEGEGDADGRPQGEAAEAQEDAQRRGAVVVNDPPRREQHPKIIFLQFMLCIHTRWAGRAVISDLLVCYVRRPANCSWNFIGFFPSSRDWGCLTK